MYYNVKVQNFDRLAVTGGDSWSSHTASTGTTGTTGSTGSYFNAPSAAFVAGFRTDSQVTASALVSMINEKYPNNNTFYSAGIYVGGTAVADSTLLNPSDNITFKSVYFPILKKYHRRNLPVPVSSTGTTGHTGGTGPAASEPDIQAGSTAS
jgi:hypothetical protein